MVQGGSKSQKVSKRDKQKEECGGKYKNDDRGMRAQYRHERADDGSFSFSCGFGREVCYNEGN